MKKLLISMLIVSGITSLAHAQYNPGRPGRVLEDLERRMIELERVVHSQEIRLRDLEERGRGRPMPPPNYREPKTSCMLIDTGFKKTFLASGRTMIDAEIAVRQLCSKDVHPSYCQASPKCETEDVRSHIRGATCMIIDTGFRRTFRGDGSNLIEAEARARQECSKDVHPSYCQTSVRCETF